MQHGLKERRPRRVEIPGPCRSPLRGFRKRDSTLLWKVLARPTARRRPRCTFLSSKSLAIPASGASALRKMYHVISQSFRIRPTVFHVGQARQEDGIELMVVICLEDELAPRPVRPTGLRSLAKLHEFVQSFLGVSRPQQVLVEVGCPVFLAGPDQDVGCRDGNMVIHQIEKRRAKPNVPEFPRLAPVRAYQ